MKHQGPIAGIAARGNFVATAGYDNQIILWDAQKHRALARGNHDHLVNHCRFSHDGQWLVSASSDYTARVWAVPSLRLHTVLREHGDDVDMAVFSHDDRRIATCALDRCVRIFDLDGLCLQTMRGHTGNVLSLAWSQDDRFVISSSVDGTIRQWNADSGVEVRVTDLQVRSDSVEIAPDGTVYGGDDRGRIAIIENGQLHFVHAHHAGIKNLSADFQNGILVTLSYDRSMAIWRIGGNQRLEELSRSTLPATVWARAATLLDDGRVATGTFGATYALFDPETSSWDCQDVAAGSAINAVMQLGTCAYTVGDAGKVVCNEVLTAETGSLCNFLVAAQGHVFTGGHLGQLFDADSGALLYSHHSPLNCGVAFDRAGQACIAIGTYTGEILVFAVHAEGGVDLLAALFVYENAVKGLSYSDGVLFSVCASTDIAWHRIGDWSVITRIAKAHERIVNGCCAIGQGKFATVGRDRTLRIWDLLAPDAPQVFQSAHPNSIKCIGINDDASMILTGSYGGTLALFDLHTMQWIALQRPTSAGISSITWDRAQHRFLAASYDGGIYSVFP